MKFIYSKGKILLYSGYFSIMNPFINRESILSLLRIGEWSTPIPSEGNFEADKVSVSFTWMEIEALVTFTNLKVSINEDDFSFTADHTTLKIEDPKIDSFVKNISIVFKNNEFEISQGEAGGEAVLDTKKFLPIIKNFIPDFQINEGELKVKGTSSSASFSVSSDNQMKTVVKDIDVSYKFPGFKVLAKSPLYEVNVNLQSNKIDGEFHGVNVGLCQGNLYYDDWIETSDSIKFMSGFLGRIQLIEGEEIYESVKNLLLPVVQTLTSEENVFACA